VEDPTPCLAEGSLLALGKMGWKVLAAQYLRLIRGSSIQLHTAKEKEKARANSRARSAGDL